jgi:L-ascorbate metabolism protein UlaG (beta-lactamase superfamily)
MTRARLVRLSLVAALVAGAGCVAPRHAIVSDNFDGRRFRQPEPLTMGLGDWIRRLVTTPREKWPAFVPEPRQDAPQQRVADGVVRVTLVNHATTLIQMDGVNILTDPIWSKRSFPVVGPRRRRAAGICFEDLPPIDVVVISHNHQDHMDLPTLRRLSREHRPRIYAGVGNAAFLTARGVVNASDLDWWQSAAVLPGLSVTAVPARHQSGRKLIDRDRTLWCGFVLSGPSGSVFFAGDTGVGSHFAEIGRRFPGLRLALLPIGGSRPAWYSREQHLGPADAVEAHRALGAEAMVPIHHGTFPNGGEGEDEARDQLASILEADSELARQVRILANGETWGHRLSPLERSEPASPTAASMETP